MKTISTQLSYFLENKEIRRNLPLLLKFIGLVVVVIVVFSVIFHFIMLYEGEQHSWITGLYWTLTVMSTLGFGDITFQTDLGRFFSVIVLVTGIMMLLVVLPFAFIRFFYAPWLEAQIRTRAPRELPPDTHGHVIICSRDAIVPGLIERLDQEDIPYIIIEADPTTASDWFVEGLSTAIGETDDKETYMNLRASQARLVLANREDIVNTNIILTVREVAPDVPIAAVSNDENAVDILELSGASHVLPLKRWLGDQLANRVTAHQAGMQPIGEYDDLHIVELPVHNTELHGKTIRESELRQQTGINIIGVWERGPLQHPEPSRILTDSSVLVVMGTAEQLENLDSFIVERTADPHPVLLIGGGTVGESAAKALARRKIPVNLIERDPQKCKQLNGVCDGIFAGDAANYELLQKAGIAEAPAVLLTTNDDSINVYLTSYCRRLNPEVRIVSRITHTHNIEAIYRAGADFVLSYATLGVDAIMSVILGETLMELGEDVDLYRRKAPERLVGQTLAQSGIGALTGVNVVAISDNGHAFTNVSPSTQLEPGMELLLVGSSQQVQRFVELFERAA